MLYMSIIVCSLSHTLKRHSLLLFHILFMPARYFLLARLIFLQVTDLHILCNFLASFKYRAGSIFLTVTTTKGAQLLQTVVISVLLQQQKHDL